MTDVSREMLESYIEDALNTSDTAQVEQALRESDHLRKMLRSIMQELDRGEHTIGAVWRRYRLTCASREQLGGYLLKTLPPEEQDYIDFHLNVIGCAYCHANLEDLQSQHQTKSRESRKRRKRFFDSSAGLLRSQKDPE